MIYMEYNICKEIKKKPYPNYGMTRVREQFSDEITAQINKLNLSICEYNIISWITDFAGKRLTESLISHNKPEEVFEKLKIGLWCSLNKLPDYSNKIVYRHTDYDGFGEEKDFFEWFNSHIGKKIRFAHFLSCSKSKWKNKDIIYRIETSNTSLARDLMPVVKIEQVEKALSEEEVMINYGAVFKVGKTIDNVIFLTELNDYSEDEVIILKEYFWESN
jgi:hypothetical protein